jgi:hypothetical protein
MLKEIEHGDIDMIAATSPEKMNMNIIIGKTILHKTKDTIVTRKDFPYNEITSAKQLENYTIWIKQDSSMCPFIANNISKFKIDSSPGKNSIEYIAKKLETLFKTDIRYIISNGFWLGINQTISTGTAFLLSIAFANLIMPETLGTYKYILSITSILLIPTLSGMDSAITQSVAKGFDGSMHLGFTTKTKWGGISFLLSLAVSIYYYISGNQTLSLAFLIISTFLPFIESFDLYGAFLNGKKLFKEFTIFNVIKKIFSSIALFTSLFLTDNVLILISVYFLSTLFP